MFSFLSKTNASYEKLAYEFSFKSIDGGKINLQNYKENVIIVVNVASRCGFTPQYENLQNLLHWLRKNCQERAQLPGGLQGRARRRAIPVGLRHPSARRHLRAHAGALRGQATRNAAAHRPVARVAHRAGGRDRAPAPTRRDPGRRAHPPDAPP